MKKLFSWIFFVLMIFIFIFDIFFAVSGLVEVQRELDRLAATPGASGVDYWGIGADILILGIIAISFIGVIFAVISYKIAQNQVVRFISAFVLFLFVLPLFSSFFLWLI